MTERDGGVGAPDSDIPTAVAYRVALPEFEGPLDLLLHLCKSHEIAVVDLPIAFITEKYLAYLQMMRNLSVDVAAEYLVMAATLAYLKSRELVPEPEPLEAETEEGGGENPREALIRQLLEYQKYKEVAQHLTARPIEGRTVFVRGAAVDVEPTSELAEHSVWKLIEVWNAVLEKGGPRKTHDVVVDRVSISDRINQVIDLLEAGGGSFRFDELVNGELGETEQRHQIVVTLLALLELARLRVIHVMQESHDGPFYILRVDGSSLDDARKVHVTSADLPDADADDGGHGDGEPLEDDVVPGDGAVSDGEAHGEPAVAALTAAGANADGELRERMEDDDGRT